MAGPESTQLRWCAQTDTNTLDSRIGPIGFTRTVKSQIPQSSQTLKPAEGRKTKPLKSAETATLPIDLRTLQGPFLPRGLDEIPTFSPIKFKMVADFFWLTPLGSLICGPKIERQGP